MRSPFGPCAASSLNVTSLAPQLHSLAATPLRRSRKVAAALRAAKPFRSEPDEAAVAEVLGTLSVRVAVIRTRSGDTPSASATTWITFTCSPWPISVPPWFRSTEPSL